MAVVAPVIIDLVGSRYLEDRKTVQSQIREEFARVDPIVPPTRPLWATVGDEFQVIYRSVSDAFRATAVIRLLASGRFDCRFGIGQGDVRTIEEGERGPIDEGEGWYRARLALEEAERMQAHGYPWLRTWATFVDEDRDDLSQTMARAHLTARDHIISRMKAKEARIAAAWLLGARQKDIAREEKISQSAISQKLEVSGGAALAQADHVFHGGRS